MSRPAQLLVQTCGTVRCVYSEAIDLSRIGQLAIARGSHVEPDEAGQWYADLCPVGGPRLGPFFHRSHALSAESDWLDAHWLAQVLPD